jgi:hypothetical protein
LLDRIFGGGRSEPAARTQPYSPGSEPMPPS